VAERGSGGPVPNRDNICGIMVTYHPDTQLFQRLAVLVRQIAALVIVDNHSDIDSQAMLQEFSQNPSIKLIVNSENRGVAAALNQGMSYVSEAGYAWVLLIDQDTIASPELVDHLINIHARYPCNERLAIVAANYQNPQANRSDDDLLNYSHQERRVVITSGSLLSVRIYSLVGEFREDFFIDLIDAEYCLRLRTRGYVVLISRRRLMTHSFGDSREALLFGRAIVYTNHSPLRRRYITRNRLSLIRRYWYDQPLYCCRQFMVLCLDTLLIVAFETEKIAKVRAMIAGFADFLERRMGKLRSF
jgi:rhamnosyltransferase